MLINIFDVEPQLLADRPGQLIIADKGYRNAETEAILAARGATLLRPAFKSEPRRPGEHLLKTVRQLIESINQTLGPNSTSNATAAEPPKEWPSASCNASSP